MTDAEWKAMARDLKRILKDGLRTDEPMSRHTTIGVGGAARLLAIPSTMGQVGRIVHYAWKRGLPYTAVGKGSNLIVRDGGFDGMVVKMGSPLSKVKVNKTTVSAQGGASFALMSRKMTKMGRTGLEFGIGIPGTVGGAVRMNAGAFGGEVKDVLRRARIVDRDGVEHVLKPQDIRFSYRRSHLPEGSVVLSATFHCPPGEINHEAYRRSLGRKETQPIWERTFGSTFVNPPGGFAAEMVEKCGLKGTRRGGAMISDMHANFIVNKEGKATAKDVEALIRLMQREVKRKFGVVLKTEVVIIGNR